MSAVLRSLTIMRLFIQLLAIKILISNVKHCTKRTREDFGLAFPDLFGEH